MNGNGGVGHRPGPDCQPGGCSSACRRDRRPSGRSVPAAAGRAVLVGCCLLAAVAGLRLLTVAPGYTRQQRGSLALQYFSRALLAALRVRVVSTGTLRTGASLVVANHVSWLDVLALAAAGPMVPLAKTEIARWPVIGRAASNAGTLFVCRESWRELPGTVDQMTAALRRGHRIQVFPESTTRCGRSIAPFHRAAFQAAVDAGVVVSPAALNYRTTDGDRSMEAAFVGDDDLLGSLWRVLRAGPITVRVQWLPVIPAIADRGHRAGDRAAAARRAERAVARALGQPVLRPAPPQRKPVEPVVPPTPLRPAPVGSPSSRRAGPRRLPRVA